MSLLDGINQTESLLQALRDCQPGSCFGDGETSWNRADRDRKRPDAQKQIKEHLLAVNEQLAAEGLRGFVPDFGKEQAGSYSFNHTLLGRTEVNVYMGVLDGRAVEWHMAHDSKGRVWIDRISYQDSEISNYGINSEILDSGILTNKPLEYESSLDAEEFGGRRCHSGTS